MSPNARHIVLAFKSNHIAQHCKGSERAIAGLWRCNMQSLLPCDTCLTTTLRVVVDKMLICPATSLKFTLLMWERQPYSTL